MGADLAQQVLGVARLADDLDARVLEQPHDALAQQDRVLGDDYAHGITARDRGPARRGGLSTSSRPSSAATRSASPRRPEPRLRVGAADAVVAHLDRRPGRCCD